MCVWFAVIAIAAVPQIVRHPMLSAFNPLTRFLHAPSRLIVFITLGAVFLAVTGAERSMPTSGISPAADPDGLVFIVLRRWP